MLRIPLRPLRLRPLRTNLNDLWFLDPVAVTWTQVTQGRTVP